mmetsp:Transcript_47027/g.131051  ORF Transcript_47027/g.131051 Transcript_47027/m.131051 type:complete len:257 (+) Transcript_47027:338-1108(+)
MAVAQPMLARSPASEAIPALLPVASAVRMRANAPTHRLAQTQAATAASHVVASRKPLRRARLVQPSDNCHAAARPQALTSTVNGTPSWNRARDSSPEKIVVARSQMALFSHALNTALWVNTPGSRPRLRKPTNMPSARSHCRLFSRELVAAESATTSTCMPLRLTTCSTSSPSHQRPHALSKSMYAPYVMMSSTMPPERQRASARLDHAQCKPPLHMLTALFKAVTLSFADDCKQTPKISDARTHCVEPFSQEALP